jgi:hypothetical protein
MDSPIKNEKDIRRHSSSANSQTIINNPPLSTSVAFKHRQSVRSISENTNVIIGAHRVDNGSDLCTHLLVGLTWFLIIIFFPFSLVCIFRVIQEYERGMSILF